jgi:hypothetical protein
VTPDESALGRVVALLHEYGVPYMLTGSVASGHHGRPRMTQDVDIVIDPERGALERLVEALTQQGFYVDRERAIDALARRRPFNVIDPETAFKFDLIVRKDRPFSREELARGQEAELAGGTRVRIATPEDTILSKLEWSRMAGGSERQLADAAGIVSVQGPALDRAYIERWAAELGISDLWAQVSAPA